MRRFAILLTVMSTACGEKTAEEPPPLLDCDTLIEPADLANACGIALADVTIIGERSEDRHASRMCVMSYVAKGDSVAVGFNWAKTSSIARAAVDNELDDKPVDVGDHARLSISPVKGNADHVRHKVVASKRHVLVRLSVDEFPGKPLLCNDDGIVAMARAILARVK